MQNKKILWRALSKSKADGYGYASYRISSGLRAAGVPLSEPEDFLSSDTIENDVYISLEDGFFTVPSLNTRSFDITINNCLPVDFKYGDKYNIGFSYWETDTLPSPWIPKLKACDEVWTTSKWAGEVFRDNTGMDNVHSFRLGIESDIFYTSESIPEGPFTFLHVGSPSTRKNTQMAFEAFLRTYGAKKDYRMIIKSLGPPDARFTDGVMKLGPVNSHDRIDVIDWEMTEDELADLYRSVHCLVYPTRGEGWGMIPFNTIASGTPTICTNATSCTEYAELSVPLDYKWSSENTFGIYRGGSWADPDFDDLCDKMRYVVDNYEEVKQKTLKGATIIHKEYSWPNVVNEYKERLCQILNQ
jgi:glycosyltransferase involved in cell wall biosynthesis